MCCEVSEMWRNKQKEIVVCEFFLFFAYLHVYPSWWLLVVVVTNSPKYSFNRCKSATCKFLSRDTKSARDKNGTKPRKNKVKNTITSTTAFPNKEDPPIKNGGTSPTQLANSSFSSLTSGNGDNGEEEDVPPPSVSDMEQEAEAKRQFFKKQMEAEDAPQLLLLG